MRKLLVTTLTVLAVAGCAAPDQPEPDDEPAPSSRPIAHAQRSGPEKKNARRDLQESRGELVGTAASDWIIWGPGPTGFAADDERALLDPQATQ